MRLHHVQVSVPHESQAECRRFYGQILGLAEIPKPPSLLGRGGVWFALGEMELHLGEEEVTDRVASRRHIALEVTNLDRVRRVLEEHGVRFEEEPIPIPGWLRIYCRDPFGNRVELIQPNP